MFPANISKLVNLWATKKKAAEKLLRLISSVSNYDNTSIQNEESVENNLYSHFQFARNTALTSHRPLIYSYSSGTGSSIASNKPKIVTNSELVDRICTYASYLKSIIGVEKGDRIAVQINKSIDNLVIYLASLKIGAIYVPLNTEYKYGEIEYFIGNAKPKLFICREEQVNEYSDIKKKNINKSDRDSSTNHIISIEEIQKYISQRMHGSNKTVTESFVEKCLSNSLAALVYTSGTTGKPKGAMITHNNLISNAYTLAQYWKITDKDTLLHVLPMYHTHGLFVALNTTFIMGSTLNFHSEGFKVDTVIEALPHCTVFMGVPTYYTRLLAANTQFCADTIGNNMRLFISGSAPLTVHTWHEFKSRSGGHAILERYGMTEGQMILSNPYDGLRKPGTVGFPLPGITVRLSEDNTLEYKGPNVFAGYWKDPEKTRLEFTDDGYFKSGDRAECDEDGYYSILGREKDLIISGGLNIYPKEIETILESEFKNSFEETAVIGISHPDFGEGVVACVVLKQGNDIPLITEEHVIRTLKSKIAGYKVPKVVIFIDKLPRNSMGKVQKNILRQKYRDLFS